ncbi:MAG: hypothetical protein OHK0053_12000 [Microscillaceae bacterium]
MWIYSLREALNRPESVQFLRVDYNEEKHGWASLTQFPLLRHLQVCHFPMEAFGGDWPVLPKLETLQIEKGLIGGLPLIFLQCSQLRACTILETPLQNLPSQISHWKNLEKLQIQQTRLWCLPEEITTLARLQVLDVAHNQITHLPAALHKLTGLTTLALENNALTEIPPELAWLRLNNFSYEDNPFLEQLPYPQRHLREFIGQLHQQHTPPWHSRLYFCFFLGQCSGPFTPDQEAMLWQGLNFPNPTLRLLIQQYFYAQSPNPFQVSDKMALRFQVKGQCHFLQDKQLKTSLEALPGYNHPAPEVIVMGDFPGEWKAEVSKVNLTSQWHLQQYLQAQAIQSMSKISHQEAQNLGRLISTDLQYARLGLELALGRGLHPFYEYEVLLHYLWQPDAGIRQSAEAVLVKYLDPAVFAHLKLCHRPYSSHPSEEAINQYLGLLCQTRLDPDELGLRFFKLTQKGRRFCLQYPRAFLAVCAQSLKNNVLRLVHLQMKHLHTNIGHLSQVKILYLNDNYLETLPEGLAALQDLRQLYLQKNYFSQVPEVVSHLKNLRKLSLEHNRLIDLPVSLVRLQKLESLNLRANQLSALPEVLQKLPNLRFLDLSQNPLVHSAALQHQIQDLMPQCRITFRW